MPLENLTEKQARLIDDHDPTLFHARLAEKVRATIEAVNGQAEANAAAVLAAETAQAGAEAAQAGAEAAANADRVGVVTLRPEIVPGEVTAAYHRWPFAGSVTAVHVAASSLITSAADGITAAVLKNGGTVVAQFDLTETPEFTADFEALPLSTGVAFEAGDTMRVVLYAGADVLGGQDLTFAVTYERAAVA